MKAASDPERMRHRAELHLGPALRGAWVGYHRRMDAAMDAAGFGDRGFPDGRVLRMCSGPTEMTISEIGRQLGITRQGAAKVVNKLVDLRYVTVRDSPTSGREKIVRPTRRAVGYLSAQRKAARGIERRLRKELGDDGFAALERLLDTLGETEDVRMRDYLATRMTDS
jgi:DNA-binding MarR family transcriptional regulator